MPMLPDRERWLDIEPWFADPARRKDRRDFAKGSLGAAPRERRFFLAGTWAFLAFGSFVAFFLGLIATAILSPESVADAADEFEKKGLLTKIWMGFGLLGFIAALLWATSNAVAMLLDLVGRVRTLVAGSTLRSWALRAAHAVFAGAALALLVVVAPAGYRLAAGVSAGEEGVVSFFLTRLSAGWCVLLSLAFLAEAVGELAATFAVRKRPIPAPLRTRRLSGGTARVAHWSDLHLTAGESVPTIEGRPGIPPNGNGPLKRMVGEHAQALARADVVLVTGDATDAGRGDEWRAFFDLVPEDLRARMVLVPGNHDLNITDARAWTSARPPSGARPTLLGRFAALLRSGEEGEEQFGRKLRVVRLIAALDRLQGDRTHVLTEPGHLKPLRELLAPCVDSLKEFITEPPMRTFEDGAMGLRETTSPRDRQLLELPHALMRALFPCVVSVPGTALRVVVLDSNIESDNAITNAMGTVDGRQLAKLREILRMLDGEDAPCVVALHHHVALPRHAGEALGYRAQARFMACENAAALISVLQGHRERVVLHGHRHIRYEASLGDRVHLISAPSTTLGNEWGSPSPPGTFATGFLTLEIGWDGQGVAVAAIDEHCSTLSDDGSYG